MHYSSPIKASRRPFVRLMISLLFASILLLFPLSLYAATINVDGSACALPEAIVAANTNSSFAGCVAGSGSSDTLVLTDTIYSLDTVYSTVDGANATPSITTTVVISGGPGIIIERKPGSPAMRLFHIGAGGNLTIKQIILRNGTGDADGGAIYNNHLLTLIAATVVSNTATILGGAVYNDGTATMTSTQIISNTAEGGGGIHNTDGGTVNLLDTEVTANKANSAGGISNVFGSILNMTDSRVTANRSGGTGGGIGTIDSTVTLTNTLVASNWADILGGGIHNGEGSILNMTDSRVTANRVGNTGGGIDNAYGSTVTLTNTLVASNWAEENGGGISNYSGKLILTNTQIVSNTAATGGGGGIYNDGLLTITASKLLTNSAGSLGSAIYQYGNMTVDQSCIVDNRDIAIYVNSGGGGAITATNNWWGAADGPGGVGPGSGDSIGANVNFSPFLTSAPAGCPNHTNGLLLKTFSTPTGNLLPGQPVTYTVSIANNNDFEVDNFYLSEQFPASFVLDHVVLSSLLADQGDNVYKLQGLPAHESAIQAYLGKVLGTVTTGGVMTHTSTLSKSQDQLFIASSSNNLVIPTLSWTSANYATTESSGNFIANVQLSPTNPNTTVTVQATISGTAQTVDFPANSGQQPVVVAITDDAIAQGDRPIPLGLQSPAGAQLGSPNQAILTIHDNDHRLDLTVEKRVDRSEAAVGETLTYTYSVVNTGEAPLTIVAVDDQLGAVNALNKGGALAVNGKRSAVMSHIVTEEDLANEPLVNIVVVTGTDNLNAHVTAIDSVSVHITAAEQPGQPGIVVSIGADRSIASVGDTISYNYLITNTGETSLSIAAVDDKLGVVHNLVTGGELGANITRTATLTHLVTVDDLAHEPLDSTVTVTGTDSNNAFDTDTDSVSVHITEAEQPDDEKPEISLSLSMDSPEAQAGDTISLTYHITNTGDVTITSISAHVLDDAVVSIAVDGKATEASPASELPPDLATSGTITYEIPLTEKPGALEKTVQILVTASNGQSASQSAKITIQIVQQKTSLPYLHR